MPTDNHSNHDHRKDCPHEREARDIALMLCEALAYTQSPMQAETVRVPSHDELKAKT